MISKSAIDEFHNRNLEDWSWLKEVPESDIQELLKDIAPDFSFKTKPYAHQLPCFVIGIKNSNFLFYLDPGTGKTLISISIIDYLKQQGKLKSALILSPNTSTVATWADQTKLHSDLSYIELTGTAEERWKLMDKEADLFFLNYTGLQVMTTETKKNQKTKKNGWVPIPQLIKKFQDKFNVVIYDESHYLKSRQSLNYEICNELSKTCEYRYGLSGTPFGRQIEDLWTQFHLIDRGETLGEFITLFRQAFFDVKVNKWGGYEYTFIKKYEKDLNKRLQNKSIRYAEEECNSLPDKIYKKIVIPFTAEGYEYYKHAVAGIIEAKGNITEIKNAFVRLRQITSGFLKYKNDEGEEIEIIFTENPKLDALCDFIQSLPEDEKVVVFNEYIKSGDLISERFKKLKIKHTRLFGGTKDKKDVKEVFLKDKNCRVFLANTIAGGTGIDGLQDVARYIIYFESPVSSIIRRQSEKRLHRSGQKKRTFIVDITVRNSIDERVLAYLKEGKDLFDALLADPKLILE